MEITNNPTVCFFDSGIGGTGLLYECVRKLPKVDFIYFADNFRVPYGSLSHNELIENTDKIFSQINELNPSAAVIACNTVTAQCIEYLRNKYKFKIVGIQPAVKQAVKTGGQCLTLVTPATANSSSFKLLVEKFGGGNTKVVACPELAAYIEGNVKNLDEQQIIKYLPHEKPNSVVLGCTHYVFAKKIIKNYYNCPIFDGFDATSDHLGEILGIFDHSQPRAQKISFKGGDFEKNRDIFNYLLRQSGCNSLKK